MVVQNMKRVVQKKYYGCSEYEQGCSKKLLWLFRKNSMVVQKNVDGCSKNVYGCSKQGVGL